MINQSANPIKSHVEYTRTKKIWFNEPTNKKQYQPVLVYHSADKMQNAIKSFPALLSHGNQSGQKRKNNSPPGRPEENAVNQSSQEQKPQRTQPKLTRWTNFTSTSTTSTTATTSSSRKESTPQSVGPSAKNHHPCQKAKQTPIWDPKQTAFRVLGNVASFTVCRLQLNVLYNTVYNLFSVLCHEHCHESSQFKFQRLWYPIVSYLTILGSSVPKGRPCKWWTWLKAVVVLAKEPNMSSSHSRITNCVIRHVRETFDGLLFASV